MTDELITDVGDCELNLCCGLWCFFFFFGFLAFWLCDSLSLCVCDSLSCIIYIYIYREREREREFLEITQISIREYLFDYLFVFC